MSFEVFRRQNRKGRPAGGDGRRHVGTFFRLYSPSVLALSRAAVEVAGFEPGGRVLLLVDDEADGVLHRVALLPTTSPDGWKLTTMTHGILAVSVGRQLIRRHDVIPGSYPLEVFAHEGRPVPGFRYIPGGGS